MWVRDLLVDSPLVGGLVQAAATLVAVLLAFRLNDRQERQRLDLQAAQFNLEYRRNILTFERDEYSKLLREFTEVGSAYVNIVNRADSMSKNGMGDWMEVAQNDLKTLINGTFVIANISPPLMRDRISDFAKALDGQRESMMSYYTSKTQLHPLEDMEIANHFRGIVKAIASERDARVKELADSTLRH